MQIMILDQGIIQFNARPKDGIAFLVKNKVITDDPLDVAKFLATTDKVDKHVLGNFLGKDNDYSVGVLNRFASLFHYEGVPFDIALRTFTNRFAMPGESQMIYRILERFSVYYSQSNPSIDKDKALIFSYALIMLNVDLHSARVKVRMTKDEFIKNTESALGGCVSRRELGEIYTRVHEKELKPDTSAEEIVYSKLAVNPKYTTKKKNLHSDMIDSESRNEILKKGAMFLKYGREGAPHARKVFISPDGKKICWIDPKKLAQLESNAQKAAAINASQKIKDSNFFMKMVSCHSGKSEPPSDVAPPPSEPCPVPEVPSETPNPPSESPQPSATPLPPPVNNFPLSLVFHGNDLDLLRTTFVKLRSRGPVAPESFKRSIPLEDVTGLVVGTGGTSNFRKHFLSHSEDTETEQRCFSIITDYRTLDLQAPPSVDIGPWLHFFHQVLSDREKRLRAAADKNKDIWSFTQKERASLVRWQEIVPQWSDHWNCGARASAGGGYRASQHPKEELLNHRMFLVNPSGFVLDRGQRLETAVSPALVSLWLEGIPSSVRPRVWPIAAGNHLRIDEEYFHHICNDPSAPGGAVTPQTPMNISTAEIPAEGSVNPISPRTMKPSSYSESDYKELERELRSSSMRKFANRALAWIDTKGSREQQAFFKPAAASRAITSITGTGVRRSLSHAHPPPDLATLTAESSMIASEHPEGIDEPSRDSADDDADSWDSQQSPMSNGWDNVVQATRKMVLAFLTQRKDVRYSRGMAHLAAMVIFNVGIQDLFRAFTVYANMLHQSYFLDFFTLHWRDMRMRFDLYSKLLRERMPYLDDHFSAIQIAPDLYFNQWMLTGFTRVLPFRTACRVWDGFMLLGESYLFTAALALLNYNEHSLMTSGFSGCLEILLGHADEVLFNEKKFFECVHAQSVSNERFAAWLSAQRLAEEKTALYDLLLLM
jgi:hypothetical protein